MPEPAVVAAAVHSIRPLPRRSLAGGLAGGSVVPPLGARVHTPPSRVVHAVLMVVGPAIGQVVAGAKALVAGGVPLALTLAGNLVLVRVLTVVGVLAVGGIGVGWWLGWGPLCWVGSWRWVEFWRWVGLEA